MRQKAVKISFIMAMALLLMMANTSWSGAFETQHNDTEPYLYAQNKDEKAIGVLFGRFF